MSGPSVVVLPTEELTPLVRAEIVRLCIAAHESEAFEGLFDFIPSGGRHALASIGGAIVGHAVATTRWLQMGDSPLMRTAFIDAVSTLPAVQGTGVGSAVMRALAAAVEDHDVGCLQTDRQGFYARLGWQEWEGPLGGRDGDTVIPTPEQQGVMVLRLPRTPPLDLTAGLTIERQPSRIWE